MSNKATTVFIWFKCKQPKNGIEAHGIQTKDGDIIEYCDLCFETTTIETISTDVKVRHSDWRFI